MEPTLTTQKKQIRLPFEVHHLPNPGLASKPICGICRLSPSPYACPRCNIPYCSLACYQHPTKHVQCSEPFYKEEVSREIGQDGQRTGEEKGKMFELLKRFEEGQGREDLLELDEDMGEDGEGEEEEHNEDGLEDLAKVLEEVDIDSLPPDELLNLLPPHLKAQFLSAIAAPDVSPLVASLLDSPALQEDAGEAPWWTTGPDLSDDSEQEVAGDSEQQRSVPDAGRRGPPEKLDISPELKPSAELAERMIYNLLAIALAYIQTTLFFLKSPLTPYLHPTTSTSSNPNATHTFEATTHLVSLLLFLTDPKSTLLLSSFSQSTLYVRSRLPPTSPFPSPSSLSGLLPSLLRPPIDLSSPHPLALVLADIHRLIGLSLSATKGGKGGDEEQEKGEGAKKGLKVAKRKVEFLVACVGVVGRRTWEGVRERVERELGKMIDAEGKGEEGEGDGDGDGIGRELREKLSVDGGVPEARSAAAGARGQEDTRARRIEIIGAKVDEAKGATAKIVEIEENDDAAEEHQGDGSLLASEPSRGGGKIVQIG